MELVFLAWFIVFPVLSGIIASKKGRSVKCGNNYPNLYDTLAQLQTGWTARCRWQQTARFATRVEPISLGVSYFSISWSNDWGQPYSELEGIMQLGTPTLHEIADSMKDLAKRLG